MRRPTEDDVNEIIRRYTAGESSRALGAAFDIHYTTVISYVKKAGVVRSRPHGDPNVLNKDTIRRRASRFIPLKDKTCEECGSTDNLQRHHTDYSKPLEIVILCPKCHNKSDKQLGFVRGKNRVQRARVGPRRRTAPKSDVTLTQQR